MPRKILENQNNQVEDINILIDNYFKANAQKKEVEKVCKQTGDSIKKYLNDNNLTQFEGTNHNVKLSVSETVSYDDVKLLEIVKSLPEDYQARLIDTIQVVNVEKLEREIIQNNLKVEQFKDAEEKKQVTRLLIK